jgi:lysosomal-associated transmembrane protein
MSLAINITYIAISLVAVIEKKSSTPGFFILSTTTPSSNSIAANNDTLSTELPSREGADHRVIEILLNVGAAMFAASLIYGVIKGCAKFLLPYFCLQVFDFCLSMLVLIQFFTYEPDMKRWLSHQKWFPMQDYFLSLSNGLLVVLAGTIAIFCLWIKAYCISVVWTCYKYLIHINTMSQTHPVRPQLEDYLAEHHFHGVFTPVAQTSSSLDAVDNNQVLMPPKYEDVLQMSRENEESNSPTPPPSYQETLSQ